MVFAVAAHFLPGLQDANVGIGKGIVGIQSRQGITISAPEEIAYINGFITTEQLLQSAALYGKSPYGEHLKAVAEGRVKY